jgi:hypothetical protein
LCDASSGGVDGNRRVHVPWVRPRQVGNEQEERDQPQPQVRSWRHRPAEVQSACPVREMLHAAELARLG